MSLIFAPDSIPERGAIEIFLVDNVGAPSNAAQIYYTLYDVTSGTPVQLGPLERTPINPEVGEYYATFHIPSNAREGLYRVRWKFRQTTVSPENVVWEEFTVKKELPNTLTLYSGITRDMIRRLRILLRDNCVRGDQRTIVRYGKTTQEISLEALWEVTQDRDHPLTKAASEGRLFTRTLTREGSLAWGVVSAVMKHPFHEDSMLEVETVEGTSVMTKDHKIYTVPWGGRKAQDATSGIILHDGMVLLKGLVAKREVEAPEFVYDLTVEETHNFILQGSNLVVSNCPDRNYHFRPPAHEETINNFTRVFGYIWEDYELVEYLERGVDFVNLYPPMTGYNSIDQMVTAVPAWRQMILMAAMAHALMALSINWTAEEFSVGPETLVTVEAEGELITLPIQELFEILVDLSPEVA